MPSGTNRTRSAVAAQALAAKRDQLAAKIHCDFLHFLFGFHRELDGIDEVRVDMEIVVGRDEIVHLRSMPNRTHRTMRRQSRRAQSYNIRGVSFNYSCRFLESHPR